jgi:hypothetical protein
LSTYYSDVKQLAQAFVDLPDARPNRDTFDLIARKLVNTCPGAHRCWSLGGEEWNSMIKEALKEAKVLRKQKVKSTTP